MFFDPLKEVAGYREAVDTETRGRDIPWLGLTETICGVTVLPFTPRHFLILSLIGSPFLCGGFPSETDVSKFLWVVSPGFVPAVTWSSRWRRSRFVARHCRKLEFQAACKAVGEYVSEAIPDEGDGKSGVKSYYSCACSIVDTIASEYGWERDTILDTPFKQLFQSFRAISRRHDPDCKFVNPSQRLISEHLAREQAALNQHRN